MSDDQGWGDVGYNGHPLLQTPNLDAAAAKGLRFDNFYAAAPSCSPTRASVLTGRHPNRMGVFSWGHPIRPQEVTIAETLSEPDTRRDILGNGISDRSGPTAR
jgi:arylsulfatase A-like enzyme